VFSKGVTREGCGGKGKNQPNHKKGQVDPSTINKRQSKNGKKNGPKRQKKPKKGLGKDETQKLGQSWLGNNPKLVQHAKKKKWYQLEKTKKREKTNEKGN